ncbi:hypothetical protein EV217_1600 [Phyllobacterium myrsinacearum]|uniref:hypothetical protein n=1 Tax=Phyllobacterium myrsinacearum TaxID=28101 RepID=UPI00102A2CBE|nr:hypothetical protein [Phyllobacterium myrsinacearum]RZS89199.1 hypothetical protein EV217_1600 [Phyllobacterium myrsinacearum]
MEIYSGWRICLLGLVLICAASAASAAMVDPHVLQIERQRGKPIASYKEDDLAKSFAYRVIKTRTPWSNDVQRTYRGFSLIEILAKNGLANAQVIKGIAPDNYSARIAMDEIKRYNPIVASQIACNDIEAKAGKCREGDFRPLEPGDFGPFSIVWPVDNMPQASDPEDHSRWVWFLTGLQFEQ